MPDADVLPRRAVEHLLQTARRHLGMQGAFLAELTENQQIYRATSEAESFTVLEGGSVPRVESYCQYVVDTGRAWVVRDTARNQRARRLAITAAGEFGAYIGVPVVLPDGTPFGTLCCLSHEARPDLGDRDVAVLEALAETLAFHVAQLEERSGRIADLEAHADDLGRAVRQSELWVGLFSEMTDASETPTLVLDPATLTIDFANAAASHLLGVPAHEAVGTAVWRHREDWTEQEARDRLRPLVDGSEESIRYEQDAGDGWPAIDVVAQRMALGDGDELILWTARDITSQREAEARLRRTAEREREANERLRRLDEVRDAFLSAVSHELRTPLTAVLGCVQTLHERELTPQVAEHLMQRLSVNAERLDRLITDLLDLNEFTGGAVQLERQQVRLDELVRAVVRGRDGQGPAPDLELAPVEAEVAPRRFERVVANLLANAAVHAAGERGPLVRLAASGGGALLVVTDRGTGVPAEHRQDVFQPFWQGPTAPAHSPGVGIGLSLVSAFSELHGGRTWVDDAPGGGAAFHVWIPVRQGAAS